MQLIFALLLVLAPQSELSRAVDPVFADYAKPGSPGCAVGIARGGKTLLERGYGLANLEHDIPITAATIFEAGSVSKQFAAASILMLAADGKLSIDDPARKYVPELDESASGITIRQLLSHTSGLRDFGPLIAVAGWPRGTRLFMHADILEILSRQRALNFTPGTQWTYNTGAYNLLAVIVERVSGTSFPTFTRDRIFNPLGMTHSSWRDDYRRVVRGRATAYAPAGKDAFRTDMDVENIYGNCCMLTTVGDLLRWNENFGTATVVGRAALDAMQTPAILADGRKLDYGFGLFVDERPGRRVVYHGGATAGYRAFLARHIDDDLSVALLCNRADVSVAALEEKVVAAVQKKKAEPVNAAVATEGAQVVGLWRDPNSDAILRIDQTEGKLRMRPRPTGNGPELVPLGPDRYRIGRNELKLEPDGLHLISGHKPEAVYVRVDPAAPTAADLAAYSGTYSSDEAAATWVVAVEDGKLVAKPRSSWTIRFEPTYADAFISSENDLVRFTRDATGRIDGLDAKWEFSMFDGSARLERLHFVRAQ